jgi:hypothetical protein
VEASRRWLRLLAGNAALFVAYVAGALLVLRFQPMGGVAAFVWPSSGLALAVVRLYGWELLPAVFLGELVVMSRLTSAPLAAGTTALAVTAEEAARDRHLRRT